MSNKIFPIQTATACQLKWAYSTVYLNTMTTASCCMAHIHKFDLESFDFHNTPEKIRDRELMLEGHWPRRGCEFCKDAEAIGSPSDRTIFNNWPEYQAPQELFVNPSATKVTPRTLQLYWGNKCNLKCVYCFPVFSSQINNENKKYGRFFKQGVGIPDFSSFGDPLPEAVEKLNSYIVSNIVHIDHIMILGGEPLIQKETYKILDLLRSVDCSHLKLHINSNLTIDHDFFKNFIDKVLALKVKEIQLIGSLDCVGPQAEYLRNGLQLDQWFKNFEYAQYQTEIVLNIHSTLTCLNTKSLPDLVDKINQWSKFRPVFWDLKEVQGRQYLDYKIFGPWLLDQGIKSAIELFNAEKNPDKEHFKNSYQRIITGLQQSQPDLTAQQQCKIYLEELDRRRGTDYRVIFPEIAQQLESL